MLRSVTTLWNYRRGFSLIELMLVVAILGVLATIAVPQLRLAVLKARRAEAKTVLAGVGLSELAYYSAHDVWVDTDSNPGSPLTEQAKPWKSTIAGWSTLGYSPDGNVRCTYYVDLFGGESWARGTAECDVDNDNGTAYQVRYYIQSTSSLMTQHGWVEVNASRF